MTTRIPETSPLMRKAPQQARSRATIEAVLDAAAQVLGERGWAGITTNYVAARAGVSIGSLYQYFPNKTALINAVKARHLGEVLEVLDSASSTASEPRESIGRLVDGMIAIHSRYPAAHGVLLEDGLAHHERESPFTDQYMSRYKKFVVSVCGERDIPDLDVVAQMLASVVSGVIHDAARQQQLSSIKLRDKLVNFLEAGLSNMVCKLSLKS